MRQESLLFHPEPLPADFSFAGRYAPDQEVEEMHIPVDGAVLNALLFLHYAGKPVAILGRALGTGLATRLADLGAPPLKADGRYSPRHQERVRE